MFSLDEAEQTSDVEGNEGLVVLNIRSTLVKYAKVLTRKAPPIALIREYLLFRRADTFTIDENRALCSIIRTVSTGYSVNAELLLAGGGACIGTEQFRGALGGPTGIE